MAETAAHPAHFELDASILRRDRRILRVALAGYLPAGIILTAAAAWAASQPGDVIAAVLIAVGAVQVDYFVAAAIAQLWLADKDLRRAGSAESRLTVSSDGIHTGLRLDPAWYNISIDALADAFERYVTIEVKVRPRAPVFDDPPGTVTFFVNLIGLRARRDRHVRGLVRLIAMLLPATAGLLFANQPAVAALVLAVATSAEGA